MSVRERNRNGSYGTTVLSPYMIMIDWILLALSPQLPAGTGPLVFLLYLGSLNGLHVYHKIRIEKRDGQTDPHEGKAMRLMGKWKIILNNMKTNRKIMTVSNWFPIVVA